MARPVFLLLASLVLAAPALAQNNTMALVCIENQSSLTTVRFEYQWGDDAWQTSSIERGYWRRLFHRFDFPDENTAPTLRIRFDADATDGTYFTTQTLQRYNAPSEDCNGTKGKKYRFTRTGNRLSLVARN